MRSATPAFFCCPFEWNIFFHPLAFSLYVSVGPKWVSCRQHIYGSYFCIHSASLCLLVGAFNPFTFKVIIDIYVPIAPVRARCGGGAAAWVARVLAAGGAQESTLAARAAGSTLAARAAGNIVL